MKTDAFERARSAYGTGAYDDATLEFVFSQLKESEDERIRKKLIWQVQMNIEDETADLQKSVYNGVKGHSPDLEESIKDWQKTLAWLEKQKEPIPIPDKFSGLKSLMLQYLQSAANRKDDSEIEDDTDLWGRKILDYVWKQDEKQKEQKPEHFELKAGKWYFCHHAFCCRADLLTVQEGERFMCEKDGVVKGFVIKEPEKYFIECSAPAPMEDEQKEQKPVDKFQEYLNASPAERRKMNTDEILGDNKGHQKTSDAITTDSNKEVDTSDCKCKNLDEIAQDYVDGVKEYNPEPTWDLMQTAMCYGYHLAENKQKPAEWSEEDENIIEGMIVDYKGEIEHLSNSMIDEQAKPVYQKRIDFLNRLKTYYPQSYNDDAQKKIDDAIYLIDHYASHGYDKNLREKVVSGLKSLRPQSKQMISEDTEVLMAKLVNLLKSYRIGEETATALANRIADTYGAQRYMDGLCDGEKLHWKPSEEQN